MEPVLLLHGFPFDGSMWDPVRPGLIRAGVRPIAPDLPGFGKTPALRADATVDDFAAAALAHADAEGLDGFLLAGHSFGGYVALAVAAAQPQRVRGIALVSSRASPDDAAAVRARVAATDRVQTEGPGFFAETLLPKMLAPRHAERLLPVVERYFQRLRAEGAASALHAMARRPDRTTLLPALKAPAAVLHGEEDQVIPVAEAEAATQGAPQARLVRLAGVGHLPPLEAPDATAAAIAQLAPPAV